jgi:hypothetical protein
MANLIIKSSADNLVLQGSDASPAITVGATGTTTFAENATLSGTGNQITSLGTVTAGTLGSAVNLNHDAQEDSWHIYLGASTNYSSSSQVDFTHNVFIGSDVSESGGAITVTNSGLYWVSVAVSKKDSQSGAIQMNLRINGTQVNGTFLYAEGPGTAGENHQSKTVSVPLRLAASDVVSVYGVGYLWGVATNAMSYFSGTRIGAIS